MARTPNPAPPARKRRTAELIVNLDEFASLCGVSRETMRDHLKTAPPKAPWILERGTRGRGYKIAAEAAVAWWQKRSVATGEDDVRLQRMAQMRLTLMGGDASEEDLVLTGKQRGDEFKAGMAELEYREAMGELVRASDIEAETVNAVIELRRQLQGVGRKIRRKFNLEREVEDGIDELIAEQLRAFVKTLDVDVDVEPDADAE